MTTVALILALISGATALIGLLGAYSVLDNQTNPESAETRLQRFRLWLKFVHGPARRGRQGWPVAAGTRREVRRLYRPRHKSIGLRPAPAVIKPSVADFRCVALKRKRPVSDRCEC